MTDVEEAIGRKIVRRHPHVFGEAQVKTAARRKPPVGADQAGRARGGRRRGGADSARARALSTASRGRCRRSPPRQEMQERAAHLGYDWPDIVGVIDKVHEELAELEAAATDGRAEARGGRRPAARRDQPGPPPRRRGRGRAAGRQRQVPRPLPARRADGSRAQRAAARPDLRRTRRLVGCRKGPRQRAEAANRQADEQPPTSRTRRQDPMTIGAQPVQRADGRLPGRPAAGDRSPSASRSGPRARA